MKLTKEIIKDSQLFIEPDLQDLIAEHALLKTFEKNEIIVREGQFIKFLPIVLSGNIRVSQTKEDKEILLYYVEKHQTCMMSLSACFFNNQSPSKAVTVEETSIMLIPSSYILEWQTKYNSWNNFILKTFRNRYDELLNAFTAVVFEHIDTRLMSYLKNYATASSKSFVCLSHQELANELGTNRVVISRILKQLEQEKKIKLFRKKIEIL